MVITSRLFSFITCSIARTYWQGQVRWLPARAERSNVVLAYHKRLTSLDEDTRFDAASHWARYESVVSVFLLVVPRLIIRIMRPVTLKDGSLEAVRRS